MSLSPPPVTALFFVCKVIAFTPVGDLGRFNHTISSPGQVNQIVQINRGSTGDIFPAPSPSLCLMMSLPYFSVNARIMAQL